MKVAQILYSGLGGHGSVAFSIVAADTAHEWRHVLGFVGIEPLVPAYREACVARRIDYATFHAQPGRPWREWARIYRWLRKSRPDAVILHSPPSLLPALLYTLATGARPIVVEHQPNALKRRSDWLFGAAAMVCAKFVVTLTPAYRSELRRGLGRWFREAKTVTIPNGIDTSKFRPRDRTGIAGREVRLGMAARFTPAKRQGVLIEALVELRRVRPDIEWRLGLAGDGETWRDIAARISAEGLEAHVMLPGNLDEDALADWLRSLDIYLHASDGETLSTSMLQAMACQLPIVGSDAPGVCELVVGQPPCGTLAKNEDPGSFARAVVALVDDPSKAFAFASAGRQRCVADFSNDRMYASYRKLVE